jgi:hypothetical protein
MKTILAWALTAAAWLGFGFYVAVTVVNTI